jgi:hypothetical protein
VINYRDNVMQSKNKICNHIKQIVRFML